MPENMTRKPVVRPRLDWETGTPSPSKAAVHMSVSVDLPPVPVQKHGTHKLRLLCITYLLAMFTSIDHDSI